MPLYSEGSYNGTLVSLSGWQSPRDQGRLTNALATITVGSGAAILLIAHNPKRICALITNTGDTGEDLYITLGPIGIASTLFTAVLKPGGSFQIDHVFPWVGEIYGIASGTMTATVHEVQIV